MDALEALIAERAPGAPKVEAFDELIALKQRIDQMKVEAASSRLDQIRQDLQILKARHPAEYQRQSALLRDILDPR